MVLLLTLRGTPTLYYGEELVTAERADTADRVRDPFGINAGGTARRDPVRTPCPGTSRPCRLQQRRALACRLAANAAAISVEATQRAIPTRCCR